MDQEGEFAKYVSALAQTLEHADRVGPLRDYCRGLMLCGDRKSVEPMAALVAPREASAKHQSMHHFVAKAQWNDAASLGAVRRQLNSRSRGRIRPGLHLYSCDCRHRFAHGMGSLHHSKGGLRIFSEASLEYDEILFLREPDSTGFAHGGLKVRLMSQQSDGFFDSANAL